jgi:pentatricopeptide repeat protein
MICSFCGGEFHRNETKYIDICIDRYSKDYLFDHLDQTFELCPHCGILMDDLTMFTDDQSSQETIRQAFLNCKEYQELLHDKTIDKLEKKLLLGKIVEQKIEVGEGKHTTNIDVALFTFYLQRGLEDRARIYLNNQKELLNVAIENSKKFNNTNEITSEVVDACVWHMLKLIDMYRRIGDFDEANKLLDLMGKYKFKSRHQDGKMRYKLQKSLCKAKDKSRALWPKPMLFCVK